MKESKKILTRIRGVVAKTVANIMSGTGVLNIVLKISGKFVSTKRNVSDFTPWLHFSHEFPKGPFNWPASKFQPVI